MKAIPILLTIAITTSLPLEAKPPAIEPVKAEMTIEEQIKAECERYGIEWETPLAISKLETGHFTSAAYKELNNIGGMMQCGELLVYGSRSEGVKAFVGNLATNYYQQGYDTIEKISYKYCPPNARKWAELVERIKE